ncbi:SIR2 family protein [Sinorhizobium fredii]|uniref:SIR2 family protein n=1 Tax=Rhizobium fredii TaxID=380 RepID=UPI003519C564
MSIPIAQLVSDIIPRHTVLLFGAGSSIPSGAPSVQKVIQHYEATFGMKADGFTFAEFCSLVEQKKTRARMIEELRKLIVGLHPQGGLRNLPLYDWRSIFSTNYDDLIERAYKAHGKTCRVYSSNFDFTLRDEDPDALLFKLHGTIEKDIIDGNNSRIILTEADNELTEEYRQSLYDRMKGDLAGANLVVIGQSLRDRDMKDLVDRAAKLARESQTKIYLLLYEKNEDLASLYERRGITIAFGGIDEFFSELAKVNVKQAKRPSTADDITDRLPGLAAATIDVKRNADPAQADMSRMFAGWPASFSDIVAGLTFPRNVAAEIVAHLNAENTLSAIVVGAAGVGKSTAIRQAMLQMEKDGARCWQHRNDFVLVSDQWMEIAAELRERGDVGVLFIDDVHSHLHQLNDLVDRLVAADNAHLKLILATTRNHWYPRVKTPNIYKYGKEFGLSKLSDNEIERLLVLVDQQPQIRVLVERTFSGFSKTERRRRLAVRCEADMFVCLKNIFAIEAFDDIILREYAELQEGDREVYRYVAAMENAGVRVHRQLVIRLLGISSQYVQQVLLNLRDIISEYDIDQAKGIYGWHCRHPVIAEIITRFKFNDLDSITALFDRVIDNISPTYDVEIRTIRELCNLESGIARIPDREEQNRLLRKMISIAPGERVPRHRLIRNFIEDGAYEKADTEIRLFKNDFGSDGPVHRYRIKLLVARSKNTPKILEEDRIALLQRARALAEVGVERYPNNKNLLTSYADVGIELYRRTGNFACYDEAIRQLRIAEDRLADPEIGRIITGYERRIASHTYESRDEVDDQD